MGMHIIGHFRTITRHRNIVLLHCIKAGIPWRGLMHDLSKYSPTEFLPGARFYSGTHSPTEEERREYGCSYAWMHHKGRNKHHFEYWTDYSMAIHGLAPVKMPLVYVIEMFCDRVAASKVYLGSRYVERCPLDYFLRGHDHLKMHPQTKELLGSLLSMLAEKGEKETFRYIRKELRPQKTY